MKTDNINFHNRHAAALTLLELVVVIAILAILSAVAVRSLTGVADQSRFEATQRTLEQIREAIIGTPNDRQADGSLVVSGFVADMGRPPIAQLSSNLEGQVYLTLNELLYSPGTNFEYALRQATTENGVSANDQDPDISIPTGWRGPYLHLPVGATELIDGWGTPLANLVPLGTNFPSLLLTSDNIVAAVSSAGGNGAPTNAVGVSISSNDYTAILRVDLIIVTNSMTTLPSDTMTVKVYGPDKNNTGKILAIPSPPTNQTSFIFNNLTQGPKAVRAYYSSNGTNNVSSIKYLTLRPGFNTTGLTIVIP